MSETSVQWTNHIELYVNSAATPPQQAASVDAVANLVKKDVLTLEALVREMEMYLTTTDAIIRSRGILLLAEVLERLTSKPLHSTTIHSLIGFFTERLADWKALRGAIVGCVALLKRKNDVGIVTNTEVKAVAQSYLDHLQVQSLGQHDRKLSFQLIECILDRYPGAVRDLGETLIYGICEAVDGEKDPQCLLIVFHLVECLAKLYPGPSGPLANYAEELFEILGSYFPIHFTHPNGEDDDVKREELSRALMLAFASTPLFEPFSVPLLLDKLSSSLLSAKVESFRYLSCCTTKYGPDRMAKHAQVLWSSIKDVTYISPQSTLSMGTELTGGMSFQDSDLMTQAFVLLQEVIRQDGEFISLIVDDYDINTFVNSQNGYKDFDVISQQEKQRLHAVGRILSACAQTSVTLCNKVFEKFFLIVMDALRLSVATPSDSSCMDEDCIPPVKLNFGALYLCVEFLEACRYLTASLDDFTLIPNFSNQPWCVLLSSFSESLMKAFISLLRSNVPDSSKNAYVFLGVKGLQILAAFPKGFSPVSKSMYDSVLLELVTIVTSDVKKTFLWTVVLKALVDIGFFIDKFPDFEKAASFESRVVEKFVSLISSDDSSLPSSLKLQAAFDIGATRKDFMLKVVQGLDEAISTNFSAVNDLKSDKLTVELLDTYSQKVLPWFHEMGGSEEIPLNFALGIWDRIGSASFNQGAQEISSDLLVAIMAAMKKAVGSCCKERQEIIINKALVVLSSSNVFGSIGYKSDSSAVKGEGLRQTYDLQNCSGRDEWLTSLFASVVIALRPQTSIPNGNMILQLFTANLLNGHIASAHALGSLVNKLPLEIIEDMSGSISLNEALDLFHSCLGTNDTTSGYDGSGIDFSNLRLNSTRIQIEINKVIGLAWVGKGLLMRGHERVKDVTMTLLSFLTLDKRTEICDEEEDVHLVMRSAGDAFHIIMSDSGECLNRTYNAVIRPLYKQRFFSTITPILLSLVTQSETSIVFRAMLYRAFAHVVSDTPLAAILGEARKLLPILLECLSILSKDVKDKDIIYSVLLVVSGILMEKNGQEAAIENTPRIINQLIELTAYPHVTAIRETSIQCLGAMRELPHTRIYPFRSKVLQATSKALDDPKRIVRQEAVRCGQAWGSIGSRSLRF